jgi:DNA helicase-2/ATP-dependent DNA helicase PcrA
MAKNELIIAAAGSGKTTYLVKEALKIKDKNILITTYTDANEEEIKKTFIFENGVIPNNVTIQTWYSFMIQHGVKPYQGGIFEHRIDGLNLVNGQSTTK